MRQAVICEPLRTPVGGYGGVFREVPTADLATRVLSELLDRTGIDGADVDDVIFGQCYPNGEAPAIGRVAVDEADLIDVARDIAAQLSDGAQEAIRWTKYSLNQWYRQHGPMFDASLGLEFLGFGGPDVVEGVASHRERRAPTFDPDSNS